MKPYIRITMMVMFALVMNAPKACAAEPQPKPSVESATPSPMAGTPFSKYRLTGIHDSLEVNAYLATGTSVHSPLLVMIQGSGCDSVFAPSADGQMQSTAGQDIVAALSGGRYNILIVDKPHVRTDAPQTGGQQDDCSLEFRRDHTLDNWSGALSASIDRLKENHLVTSNQVRILGLSEGALVAARLAATRSDVSHVAFISSFGCHQIDDMLVTARRNWIAEHPEAKGDDLQTGIAEELANVEQQFKTVFENPDDHTSIIFGQTPKFWSTFGLACPADDLQKTNADVFVAYGTADEQISAEGIEEIISRRLVAGKSTHTIRIIGGNHVLQSPSETQPFENLISVFQKSLDWMQTMPNE